MQLRGVADVDVQRGGTGVEFLRQAAHGDPFQTLRTHERDGGVDDAVPGESGLGGAVAAAAGGRGVRCHALKVTNMFVANKFVTNMFVNQPRVA
ncbi:hypothetical protein GCM10010448_62140 [Streptomyces glomeratus]|uniref:Uncharacterized protein n=1 Tax=Streptomyces glomeratus TaxID=284452 RepID=A0ABP6M4H0_9ACTN